MANDVSGSKHDDKLKWVDEFFSPISYKPYTSIKEMGVALLTILRLPVSLFSLGLVAVIASPAWAIGGAMILIAGLILSPTFFFILPLKEALIACVVAILVAPCVGILMAPVFAIVGGLLMGSSVIVLALAVASFLVRTIHTITEELGIVKAADDSAQKPEPTGP